MSTLAPSRSRRGLWVDALRRQSLRTVVLRSWSGRLGLLLVGLIVLIAGLGPFFAPYPPADIVGLPFSEPSGTHLLGTDTLGRDVLSRFLHGGRVLILVALLATLLAYVVGLAIAMAAGFLRGGFDFATLAVADLVLSIPAIVFVLVLLAATGPQLSIVVIGIAATHVPRIVRLFRSITIEVSTGEFVEAAVARGEGLVSILLREILPNVWTPVLTDFGLRLTGSVILFSSLSYLGLGQAPPAADWGLMISENRIGLTIQPWVIVVPALTIAVLTVGVNLLTDAASRSIGRSIGSHDV